MKNKSILHHVGSIYASVVMFLESLLGKKNLCRK